LSLLSPVGQLVVISAKHGQSPIDSARYLGIATKPGDPVTTSPATILLQLLPFPESPANANGIGPTEDDISLIWLGDSSQTKNAVGMLEAQSPATNNIAGIGQIFSGPGIGQMFNLPGLPPLRRPTDTEHHRHAEYRRHLLRERQEAGRAWRLLA
jgi:hypothetical protein